MFKWPYNAPHRAAGTKEKPFGYFDATLVGGWHVPGEPYTNAAGTDFMWWRARMLGGRTNHYGRISLRMGPYDFKPYSRDGKGFDWPITYDDLAPYYDKAEELIGVFGISRGTGKHARWQVPAGARAARLRAPGETGLRQDRHSVHPVAPRHSDQADPRPPCLPLLRPVRPRLRRQRQLQFPRRTHLPGHEDRQPGGSHRRHGARSGGRSRWPGARRLLHRQEDPRRSHRYARIVVLAASCCETARILLNSKSSLFPNGLANSSGLVGRYLMDTVGSDVGGYLPILEDLPPRNEDGVGGMHMYMPWWHYKDQKAGKMPFARGYHIEFGGGRGLPGAGDFGGSERILGGGYGVDLKRNIRKVYGAQVGFAGRGEMIPNARQLLRNRSRCGGSVGHSGAAFPFQMEPGRDPAGQAYAGYVQGNHHRRRRQGTSPKRHAENNWGIARGGEIIHEVGAARMGDDPKTSVLNPNLPGVGLQEPVCHRCRAICQ